MGGGDVKKGRGGGGVNGVWGYIYTNRFWGLEISPRELWGGA